MFCFLLSSCMAAISVGSMIMDNCASRKELFQLVTYVVQSNNYLLWSNVTNLNRSGCSELHENGHQMVSEVSVLYLGEDNSLI